MSRTKQGSRLQLGLGDSHREMGPVQPDFLLFFKMGATQDFCMKFPDFCLVVTNSPLRWDRCTRPSVDETLLQAKCGLRITIWKDPWFISIVCNFQLYPKLSCLLKAQQAPFFCLSVFPTSSVASVLVNRFSVPNHGVSGRPDEVGLLNLLLGSLLSGAV